MKRFVLIGFAICGWLQSDLALAGKVLTCNLFADEKDVGGRQMLVVNAAAGHYKPMILVWGPNRGRGGATTQQRVLNSRFADWMTDATAG